MDTDRQKSISAVNDEYDSFQNAYQMNNESFLLNDSFLDSDDEPKDYDEQSFNLNVRQRRVVEWMIAKEQNVPFGGIIATDIGSVDDKITVIKNLLFKSRGPCTVNTQSEGETDLDETLIETGHTLIVCSLNKISEWIECVTKSSITDVLNICVWYGRKKDMSLHSLCQRHIVVTTTTLVQKSFSNKDKDLLYAIKWTRIILDNTPYAYDPRLQISKAVQHLSGICRWAFIGSELIDDDDKDTYYGVVKFIENKSHSKSYLKKWNKWLERHPTVTVKENIKHIVYSKRII